MVNLSSLRLEYRCKYFVFIVIKIFGIILVCRLYNIEIKYIIWWIDLE